MRSTTQLILAGACLLLIGAPLAAQQPSPSAPPHGPGQHEMSHPSNMPMTDCPMMSAMMHGPAAALRAGGALGLSSAQHSRLEAQQRQVDAATKRGMDSMQVIHAELVAVAQRPELDERAAREAFDRMGGVHTEMGLAMLRASRETSAILTPLQRDSLAAIAKRRTPTPGAMPMHGMPMHGMPMQPMHGAGAGPKH